MLQLLMATFRSSANKHQDHDVLVQQLLALHPNSKTVSE